MKPKHLTILFAILAALSLPATAHAQCWYFACDSFGVYDSNSNEFDGYSRTVDYWWGYVWIGVDSTLQNSNGGSMAFNSANGYGEAEADVYLIPGSSGSYTIHGAHWYMAEWSQEDVGETWYYVDVSVPPTINPIDPPTLYLNDEYTFNITGSGFTGHPVMFSATDPFQSSSVSVVSDSLIQGTVHVWPNWGLDTWGTIWIDAIGAIVAATYHVVPTAPPSPPTMRVTWNGNVVQPGGTVFIDPSPSLALVASMVPGSGGGSLTGTVAWTFGTNYTGPGEYSYGLPPNGPTQAAAASWDIGAYLGGYFAGGTAYVTATYQGTTQSLSFTILGQNPYSASIVKSRIGTSPWFIQQLANSESQGYLQFDGSGYPVWGFPNGFGIMQIDYNNDVYDLWTWTENVDKGKSRNASNGSVASSKWTQAYNAWTTYNMNRPPTQQVPMQESVQEGACVFIYSPSGDQHPFSDAIWIKMYNGWTHRLFLQFVNGAWVVDEFNSNGINYVGRVCSASS